MKALKFFLKKNKPLIGSRLSQPILSPRRFTLIELLIVISIIALLVTLLAPSFTKIFEKTDSVTCMSNQSQFGKAMVAYSKDNRGKFPISRMNWETEVKIAGLGIANITKGTKRGGVGTLTNSVDKQFGGWMDKWWGFTSVKGVMRKEGKYMNDSDALFCPSILENGVEGLKKNGSDWFQSDTPSGEQYQYILDNNDYDGLFNKEGNPFGNTAILGYQHFLMTDYDPNNVTRGRHLRRPVTETRPLSMNEDPSCWVSTDYYGIVAVGAVGYFDWWPHYQSETTPINLIHNVLHLDLHVDEHETLSTNSNEWTWAAGAEINWGRFQTSLDYPDITIGAVYPVGGYDTDETKR